jgi:hypothetical protein
MLQSKNKCLAVSFACPSSIAVGDVVCIDSDLSVIKNASIAAINLVGTVAKHRDTDEICTVNTRFRERRDDREAYSVFANGPFVLDANCKAVQYTGAALASVTGANAGPFTINTPATVTGSQAGPFTVVVDTSDKVKVAIGSGADQTFTLTAGEGVVAATIADEINATAEGFTASATVDGKLKLTVDDYTNSLIIKAVTHDAYTLLGLTATTTVATVSNVLKVAMGAGGDQTFTLTPGADISALTIATEINLTATGFIASATSANKLKLTSTDLQDALAVKSVTGNAYTILGLSVATTQPTARSHDPGAVLGLQIRQPLPLSLSGEHYGPFAITSSTNKVKVNIAAGGSQTFTLDTAEAATASEIAATINDTATDFTASANGDLLVLTADNPGASIEIETVASDAYDALGFTEDTYTAPMVIETLEF